MVCIRLWFAAGAFDWRCFLASAGKLRWAWLLVLAGAGRWNLLRTGIALAVFLKPLKPQPSFRNLLWATVVGFTATSLFGRAGEFVRPYLIAIKSSPHCCVSTLMPSYNVKTRL